MPNQSLTDLPERTSTSGSDRIHVNNAGTDYQQTKAKFLVGDLYSVYSNSVSITSTADSLPAPGTYFGYIASYGHQTTVDVPANNNFYVKITRMNNSDYSNIEIWSVNDAEGAHYIRNKVGGSWSNWVQIPHRSEITSLNNSLTNWNYYNVGSNSYGAVECRYNPSLKLCFITWRGNGTAPGSTQYSFNLPSSPVLTPNDNAVVKLRNGDVMEVRTDNTVKVTLTGISWSGGSLMYPTR